MRDADAAEVLTEQQEAAVRALAAQASSRVGREREPLRTFLQRMSGGRLGRQRGWRTVPDLGTPWQDHGCVERNGWRTRSAYFDGEIAFAVDYRVCRRCGLGWVEQPYTLPRYQRNGLARAALHALRQEHPAVSWHTLGGHLSESRPFWENVGRDVRGNYQQRSLCQHITAG